MQSPRSVRAFLRELWGKLLPGVLAEMRELGAAKKEHSQRLLEEGAPAELYREEPQFQGIICPWDMDYYKSGETAKVGRQLGELTRFLTYDSLMDGVNLILNSTMGLNLRRVEPARGEVWD